MSENDVFRLQRQIIDWFYIVRILKTSLTCGSIFSHESFYGEKLNKSSWQLFFQLSEFMCLCSIVCSFLLLNSIHANFNRFLFPFTNACQVWTIATDPRRHTRLFPTIKNQRNCFRNRRKTVRQQPSTLTLQLFTIEQTAFHFKSGIKSFFFQIGYSNRGLVLPPFFFAWPASTWLTIRKTDPVRCNSPCVCVCMTVREKCNFFLLHHLPASLSVCLFTYRRPSKRRDFDYTARSVSYWQ